MAKILVILAPIALNIASFWYMETHHPLSGGALAQALPLIWAIVILPTLLFSAMGMMSLFGWPGKGGE